MMSNFDEALSYLLEREGTGVERNANDPGGISRFGISLRFLNSLSDLKVYGILNSPALPEDIENLTMSQASQIYKAFFWNSLPFDDIADEDIRNYLFDMCVNCGIAPAVKCVQRAIWAFYEYKGDPAEDGIFGINTLDYVNNICQLSQNSAEFLCILRSERAGDYRVICARDDKENVFLQGWLNRAYNK